MMNKYILYIDYCARKGPRCGWEYIKCDTTNLAYVLDQAEEFYHKNGGSENIYLIRIMERFSKAKKDADGVHRTPFKAILCKRSEKGGWHLNNEQYFENEHVAHWCRKYDAEWYEAV
jgi:hypothetical protein